MEEPIMLVVLKYTYHHGYIFNYHDTRLLCIFPVKTPGAFAKEFHSNVEM